MPDRFIEPRRDEAEVQELLAGAREPRRIEARRADARGNALFIYFDEVTTAFAQLLEERLRDPALNDVLEAEGEWRVLEANTESGRPTLARLEVRVISPRRGFLRLAIPVTSDSRLALLAIAQGGWLVLVPTQLPVVAGPEAALEVGLILRLNPSSALSRALA